MRWAAEASGAADDARRSRSSLAWFVGSGGALCKLACGNGTALRGLGVRAGGRVDRIELGALSCTPLLHDDGKATPSPELTQPEPPTREDSGSQAGGHDEL